MPRGKGRRRTHGKTVPKKCSLGQNCYICDGLKRQETEGTHVEEPERPMTQETVAPVPKKLPNGRKRQETQGTDVQGLERPMTKQTIAPAPEKPRNGRKRQETLGTDVEGLERPMTKETIAPAPKKPRTRKKIRKIAPAEDTAIVDHLALVEVSSMEEMFHGHEVSPQHCDTVFCQLEALVSSPFQDEGPISSELSLSSPPSSTEAHTPPPSSDTTQPSLPAPTPKSTSPLSPSGPSVTSKSSPFLLGANIPTSVKQHTSVSAPPKGITSLGEAQAFFAELDPMLDKSLIDLLESSQPISTTQEEINQAKCYIRECLPMNFERLLYPTRRVRLNCCIELLMKVDYFPSCVLGLVRRFHKNFLKNTCIYSTCQESIRTADKEKEEAESLREELANKRSLFKRIMGDIGGTNNELTKQLAEKNQIRDALEAEAIALMESSRSTKDAYARCLHKSKILEKEKQNSEEVMAEIDALWEHFKRETMVFL